MLKLPTGVPADVPGLWQGYREWLARCGVAEPRVTLHGGYGKDNLGDDAILHVLLTRVQKELPAAQVTIVCHGPEKVARRYPDAARVSTCGFKSVAALRAVARSHIYIIGGGGIINRINAYSGRQTLKLLDMKGKYLFAAAFAARLAGARTCFYAIGANSFPDAGVRLLAQVVLSRADVVSVRDPESFERLRDLGPSRQLVQVLDPAMSLVPAARSAGLELLARSGYRPRARPLVMIGFRHVRERVPSPAAKRGAVVRLARYLIDERGADVVFFPASQHPSRYYEDDLDLGRAVRRELGAREHFHLVEEYPHPQVAMAAFACAQYCIFERLHAVILSSCADVPGFAIAYDGKVSEYARLIGRQRECISSADFVAARDYSWLEPSLAEAFSRFDPRRAAE